MPRTLPPLYLAAIAASLVLGACDRPRDRPASRQEAATAQRADTAGAYKLLHVVGNEAGSEWTVDTTGGASDTAVAMAEGDTAYFAEPADPMREWQRARVKRIDAVRWVHPSDFFAP